MTDMKKPAREFWIENSPYGSGAATYAVPFNHKDWLKTIHRADAIHVKEILPDEPDWREIAEGLAKSLEIISWYGRNENQNCPGGCGSPGIAKDALSKFNEAKKK